ncbi:class I SAM-dependent methyltransferase [Saccharospirillum salsuginis]|uniref:Transcriptional regulator n=1 Tax=Saccharospirillum salsuginis TaxID=418750 RepID=A0A918NHL1_9GAMM|nr:class I SAM-dependent methyltransferase [Saccharospirillum salsuginis]GGX68236.1 transcriptional regulator [Saccharospirillum salsuginis]
MPFDTHTAQRDPAAFADRLGEQINGAAVVTMISLGHRLGLFDRLAITSPCTSQSLAEACDLNERYVSEWLAVMVTGDVLDYDASSATYRLDPGHAACLTRSASPDNLAVVAQYIPLIAGMEERLLQCFRTGTGLAYPDYPCFHQVMADDSYQTVVTALFDHILPLIPGLTDRLNEGIDVLDAGCGAGKALLALAQAFPRSRFVGYDLCLEAFEPTRARAEELGLDNLHFEQRDLRAFDEPGRYDWIASFDAIHDQAAPDALLAGIARALKPGGVYLMQDIAGSSYLENNLVHPLGPLLYSISCAHCTPISIGQGGPGLGTMWGEETARHYLHQAGFDDIQVQRLDHDPFNVYFVARR